MLEEIPTQVAEDTEERREGLQSLFRNPKSVIEWLRVRSCGQADMMLEAKALLSHQSQRHEGGLSVIGMNSAGITVPVNMAAVML